MNASVSDKGLGELAALPENGSGPLYRLVKRALLRLLESGRYGPGQALPSEAEISTTLGVSIGTLRKAVDELVHEHVLVRRQGKGTFVAMHSSDRFLFQFFHVEPRDTSDIDEREYPVVHTLRFERLRADELEAQALHIKAGEPVFRIFNRLRLQERPVVFDRISISAALFKGLTEKRFIDRPSTVYNLYQTDYGITVLRAHERVRAAAASAEAASVLGLKTGQPVLEVHRVALTFGDKPVEYRVSTVNTAAHDYVSMLSKRT
jgi:GntR family transcriptional regulator